MPPSWVCKDVAPRPNVCELRRTGLEKGKSAPRPAQRTRRRGRRSPISPHGGNFGRLVRRLEFSAHMQSDPLRGTRLHALGDIVAQGREPFGLRSHRLRLFGGEAFRPDHRLAIAGLQFQPALARRCRGLPLVGLGERREQRLSLRDLRHFRRRRKAFERRREDVVPLGGRPVD